MHRTDIVVLEFQRSTVYSTFILEMQVLKKPNGSSRSETSLRH